MNERFRDIACVVALSLVGVVVLGDEPQAFSVARPEPAVQPTPTVVQPTSTVAQLAPPVVQPILGAVQATEPPVVAQASFTSSFAEESTLMLASPGDFKACNPCYHESGLSAGLDAFHAKPYFEQNVAFTLVDQSGANFITSSRNFQYDYSTTPRAWLSYQGTSGFSVRGRGWRLDEQATSELFVDAAGDFQISGPPTQTATGNLATGLTAGDTVVASSSIEAYTIDGEVGQRMIYCNWDINLGGGFRHGSVAQQYDAIATNGATTDATSSIQQEFEGIGPTLFLEARRPFGKHGLSLVANGRYSLLYGDYTFSSTDVVATTTTASFTDTASLRIAEIQLGAEWTRTLSSGTRLFAAGLWEAQTWAGAGNAHDNKDALGLIGVTLSAGLAR